MPGDRANEHTRQRLIGRANVKSDVSSEKSSVFVIPAEVYELLDPIEKIVIRRQEERGEVRIITDAQVVRS